ncbi:hypothetical protein LX73_0139 [Fodinibius salinus]|uniref:CcmD family protein n=1 Tax=Fodinibius salinus TaxID=860790 RepID=A0A5D3YLT9_9BACT|nr:hypothetical protein [Fodinibius salinus]TYP94850.1 hypothetical protein LX73_0139 [Fodinibius salinus]
MNFSLIQLQQDTVAAADTLSEAYASKWESSSGLEQAGPLMQTLASHDLIFIVLIVSLIIWLVLLFFIIRTDKKVEQLEDQVEQLNTSD